MHRENGRHQIRHPISSLLSVGVDFILRTFNQMRRNLLPAPSFVCCTNLHRATAPDLRRQTNPANRSRNQQRTSLELYAGFGDRLHAGRSLPILDFTFQRRQIAHPPKQPVRRVRERQKALASVKAAGVLVEGFDHDRKTGDFASDTATERIGEQKPPPSPALISPVDRQPAEQESRHQRIARQSSDCIHRQIGQLNRSSRQRIIPDYQPGGCSQHKRRRDEPSCILTGLAVQISVEFGHSAGKRHPIVVWTERFDNRLRRRLLSHPAGSAGNDCENSHAGGR